MGVTMSVDALATLMLRAGMGPELRLIGSPYAIVDGVRCELPESGMRLLALVALRGGVERGSAAGLLWPIGVDRRASGNLRSALWRLRVAGVDLMDVNDGQLALRTDVRLDMRLVSEWALRLIQGRPRAADLTDIGWQSAAFNLLPGWFDDWVIYERERLRQRLLHGMEAMSRILVAVGRAAEAVDAAAATVAMDPLRESAQLALVEAHLARGSHHAAVDGFHRYRELLWKELRLEPGPAISTLLTEIILGARDNVVTDGLR